jgi:hypothetical protein
MNPPETKQEALIQCLLLWKELAKTGEKNKQPAARRVLGYTPFASCPACEYAIDQAGETESMCSYCPVNPWRELARHHTCGCLDPSSPYAEWVEADTKKKRRQAAKGVRQLIWDQY